MMSTAIGGTIAEGRVLRDVDEVGGGRKMELLVAALSEITGPPIGLQYIPPPARSGTYTSTVPFVLVYYSYT